MSPSRAAAAVVTAKLATADVTAEGGADFVAAAGDPASGPARLRNG